MKIEVVKNYDEISKLAAKYMIDIIKNKEDAVLGLPTGSTPIGMYKILVKEYKKNNISFSNIRTFNLDEYIGLPKTNINSYYNFMDTNLFSHIDIKKENINIPNGMNKDIINECINYENNINRSGSMDILFLGIGQNGHIGFNEPAEFFEPYTHKVKLDENTVVANSRFFERIEDVPTTAITMGIKTILSAKKIVLLATGANKADIITKTVKGKITPHLPASILQLHNDATVIVDEAAARNLKSIV